MKANAIVARYPGDCPHCLDGIRRGDIVVRAGRRWAHEHCAEREEEIEAELAMAGSTNTRGE